MSEPQDLILPAFRIEQPGGTFFVTSFSAGQIAVPNFSMPDAWTPEHREGYQRPPLVKRFKEIASYLLGREAGRAAVMSQSLLLNCRSPIDWDLADEQSGWGLLRIPATSFPLYEVDGQHRLGGIREAVAQDPSFASFRVPVVVGDNVDPLHEAVQFFDINTHQKRVPTDIAQRLIEQQIENEDLREAIVADGKLWIGSATKVVDALVAIKNQPWYQAIGIPGTGNARVIMRQVSFVQSLKPLLDRGSYADESPEVLAQMLAMYWSTIASLCPEAFQQPREYVIQKTVGVYPLHELLPLVLERVARGGGSVTEANLRRVLQGLGVWDAEFWHKRGGQAGLYAGAKGFRILFDKLRGQLPPLPSILR